MKVVIILAFACVFAVAYNSHIDDHFLMFNEDGTEINDLMSIIMRPRVPERDLPDEYFMHHGLNPDRRLKAFSFRNCGDPTEETAKLLQFQITPDPIVLPGNIGISFFLQNIMTEGSPIQTDVILKKKILGLWVPIPCIDNIGSCSYPDACELLDGIQCPAAFSNNGIPCSCPIPMGNYSLPESNFEVDLSSIPTGDYSAQATLTFPSGSSSCYEVEVTLAN